MLRSPESPTSKKKDNNFCGIVDIKQLWIPHWKSEKPRSSSEKTGDSNVVRASVQPQSLLRFHGVPQPPLQWLELTLHVKSGSDVLRAHESAAR